MKIIITESQMALIRRVSELEQIIDDAIIDLNDDIKSGGSSNKPDNFGVYENWVVLRVSIMFNYKNPNIEFPRHDFMMLISGQFNNKIRNGFNKVRKKR